MTELGHYLEELKGDGDEPVLIPGAVDIWTPADSEAIAKDLFRNSDKLPIEFIEGEPRDHRNAEFRYNWVLQAGVGAPLAALFVNANQEAVETLEDHYQYISTTKLAHWINERKRDNAAEAVGLLTEILTRYAQLNHLQQLVDRNTERVRLETEQRFEGVIEELQRRVDEERELREREQNEREGLIVNLQEEIQDLEHNMANRLPPSLQPTVRAFTPDDVGGWLDHAKRVYETHDIDEADIPKYLGQFLPPHLQSIHETLREGGFAAYKTALLEYCNEDRTPMTIRLRMLQMRKQRNESTVDFAL